MATMSAKEAFDRAVQHHKAGQFPEAQGLYRQIIAQQPNHAQSHYMLAVMGHQLGRSAEALPLIDKAISINPGSPDYHMLRGIILVSLQQLAEAAGAFRQVTLLRPGDAQAHNNLANAQRALGQFDEAIATYRRALEIQPQFPEALISLSATLKDLGRLNEAIDAARQAIAQRPNDAAAYSNLGLVLKAKGEFEAAIDQYRKAVELDPGDADAHCFIGNLYKELGKPDDAVAAYERVLSLNPQHPLGRWNLSFVKLLRGDPDAWDAYESRWLVSSSPMNRGFSQSLWDGSDLAGKTILLHAEQGLGDTIQFIRFVPMVKDRGGLVAVLCPPPLKRLLDGQLGIERVVSEEASTGPFDVHCPIMSLPRIFRTTDQTIPATVPYLRPSANLAEAWNRRISQQPPGFKVGLAWATSPQTPGAAQRSLELAALAPLAQVAGVEFYSLQKGDAAAQAKSPPGGMRLTDWTAELGDFADTAALVSNLDLIISVDTSVAHLAGALARPVWTLIPFAPDWRWKLGGTDMPWYPTMKLFRQERRGDWNLPVEKVAAELREKVARLA